MENLGVKLPNDPSFWDEIILNELGKKSPELASTVVATDIKESDYINGNLTGLIIAANGRVLIPLVVREFRVKPLDVIVYGDKIMALTGRTVSSTLFSPSASNGKLVNPQDLQIGTDISRLANPPDSASSGFVTPYNYSNKTASSPAIPLSGGDRGRMSVLEALKVASDSTKDKLATGLVNNKVLLEKVATLLPFKDILSEIRKISIASAEKTASCQDVFYIKDVDGAYTINGIAKKAEELGTLPEDVKSSLVLTGEALIAPEDLKAEITILTRKGLKPLKSTTLADVVCREGDSLRGVFLSNVISFDHNPTHKGLFLSKDRQWIYQEHLTGGVVEVTQISDNAMSYIDQYLKDELGKIEDSPKIGEYGTFILGRKAIEPFRVISLYNVSGSIVMSVAASSGQRLVVEYRFQSSTSPESGCNNDTILSYLTNIVNKENVETLPNQQPLMVASGNLVSKYFPTDRVYIVNHPYRYVSLKARRNGARTPEEALIIPSDNEDGCIVTIKKASGGYVVSRDDKFEKQHTSDLLPSKLACQYELARYGMGKKQAEILINISPVSFVLKKKAAGELPTRHSGAEIPEIPPQSYPQLLTNNTEQGQFVEQGALNTAAMLDDPETLNLLLTIGMGEIDDKVRQYVISNIGDIHDLIDKLGRLLLIIRTSKNTGISESAISDLIHKLDRSAWELNDFSGRSQTTGNREGEIDE
jgi:hypothetical protein